jgi:hypothetical protein
MKAYLFGGIIIFSLTLFLPFGYIIHDGMLISNMPIFVVYVNFFHDFGIYLLRMIIPHILVCLILSYCFTKLYLKNRDAILSNFMIELIIRKKTYLFFLILSLLVLWVGFNMAFHLNFTRNAQKAKEAEKAAYDNMK